ncbi:MAG: sodium-independent anion transporter, partial [Pseudomonadota bacterium]
LEAINNRLKDAGVTLHLSEVKGPVMDRLKRTHFLDELTGEVFMHQFEAMQALDDACTRSAFSVTPETTKPGATPCPSKTLAGVDRL